MNTFFHTALFTTQSTRGIDAIRNTTSISVGWFAITRHARPDRSRSMLRREYVRSPSPTSSAMNARKNQCTTFCIRAARAACELGMALQIAMAVPPKMRPPTLKVRNARYVAKTRHT
jgi:hypothetical protein